MLFSGRESLGLISSGLTVMTFLQSLLYAKVSRIIFMFSSMVARFFNLACIRDLSYEAWVKNRMVVKLRLPIRVRITGSRKLCFIFKEKGNLKKKSDVEGFIRES